MEIVVFKDKTYNVYHPGKIKTDSHGYVIDQLNENLPSMGRYRSKYLLKNYNLTEFEYYIIVVFLGKYENMPECEFENCSCKKYFNHLLPTKKVPVLNIGCCKKHTRILVNRISGRRLMDEGKSPILKAQAVPFTEERRKQRSLAAKKQVKDGKHPWQSKNRSLKILKNQEILKNSNINYELKKVSFNELDNILIIDRDYYIRRGNENDICYLYITELEGNPNLIKIGVTINVKNRIGVKYHNMKYKNLKVLYKSTRKVIANLEYTIKKEFMNFIKLGTESFPVDKKLEIINFINKQISIIESSSTTIAQNVNDKD